MVGNLLHNISGKRSKELAQNLETVSKSLEAEKDERKSNESELKNSLNINQAKIETFENKMTEMQSNYDKLNQSANSLNDQINDSTNFIKII